MEINLNVSLNTYDYSEQDVTYNLNNLYFR